MTTSKDLMLCAQLGISEWKLRKWQKNGKAPHIAKLAAAWLLQNGAVKDVPTILELGADNDRD